jgi:Helix-hairpin-helix motif
MKKYLVFLFILLAFQFVIAARVDLNTADLPELKSLPITEEQAEDIYDYRFYIEHYKSIYDLREIESIDQPTLNKLKPLVSVSHYKDEDEAALRRDEIYYLIERLGSNEGLQEGMSDVWEDYLMTPRNINKMPFSEILNMPNTSAIDVAAILKRRANGDTLTNYRDLRYSPGISYYGAKNLQHYVYYKDQPVNNKLYIDYQVKFASTPFGEDQREMYKESMIRFADGTPGIKRQTYWGFFNMESQRAEVMNKIRLRYMNSWKAGLMTNSDKMSNQLFLDEASKFADDAKYYVGYESEIEWQGYNFLKVYAGNYRATFGEGLVMENTDFYSPRKTGYGFNKRITGIIGDISRTQEYSLRGMAIDWKRDNFNAVLFVSNDKKDAVIYDSNENGILDKDDYALCYITMSERFSDEELEEVEEFFNNYTSNVNPVSIAPRRDAVEENLIGGHLEYSPIIGTHIGMTGYEATYDRDFVVPETEELKHLLISDPSDADQKWKMTDAEISSMYSTKTDTYDRNYRRILGFDWRTVLNNTSIQGEYAELQVDGDLYKIGDDPNALFISSFTQFENLNILTIYRDYDLEYDNPYHRSFSESERYDDTEFDKLTYGLNNTLLTDMYLNSAQPSAEKGIYIQTRYQFHRMFTLTKAYVDFWERKSDARRGVRFETKLEFKPIHQLRFKVRNKIQQKRYDEYQDRGRSTATEIQLDCLVLLSNYDKIALTLWHAEVDQPPYLSILSNPAMAGAPDLAQAVSKSTGDMIGIEYAHNFNANLKIVGAFDIWKAYGASFWDFEDIELDFDQSDMGYKYWFNIHSRIANNLFLSIKYKYKKFMTRELEYREYNEIPTSGEYYFQRVENDEHFVRLQLDLKF